MTVRAGARTSVPVSDVADDTAVCTTVEDTDGYSRAVAGIRIEAIRAGHGVAPNQVTAIRGRRFVATEGRIGFPMLTRTTIGDGRVALARITAVEPGSRWCHIALERGMTLAYASGAEHTAINLPGLRFSFAIAHYDDLDANADRLRVRVRRLQRGQVHVVGPTARTAALSAGLAALTDTARRGSTVAAKLGNDLLDAITMLLSDHDFTHSVGVGRGLDSRQIVHDCLDYATALDRIPSIGELCLAACVSERRLRQAFREEFDLPPSRLFRLWGLERARRRLLGNVGGVTVSRVATDLGFGHLGRFAGHYRQLYGETPSATLGTIRSTTVPARSGRQARDPLFVSTSRGRPRVA